MNPIEIARLAAGILNVQNLSENNIDTVNALLEKALREINAEYNKISLSSKGIIT